MHSPGPPGPASLRMSPPLSMSSPPRQTERASQDDFGQRSQTAGSVASFIVPAGTLESNRDVSVADRQTGLVRPSFRLRFFVLLSRKSHIICLPTGHTEYEQAALSSQRRAVISDGDDAGNGTGSRHRRREESHHQPVAAPAFSAHALADALVLGAASASASLSSLEPSGRAVSQRGLVARLSSCVPDEPASIPPSADLITEPACPDAPRQGRMKEPEDDQNSTSKARSVDSSRGRTIVLSPPRWQPPSLRIALTRAHRILPTRTGHRSSQHRASCEQIPLPIQSHSRRAHGTPPQPPLVHNSCRVPRPSACPVVAASICVALALILLHSLRRFASATSPRRR